MHTCIPSHRLKRSWHSCPWSAGNLNIPSMHHPQRQILNASMVGLKTVTYAKISPQMVSPRDIAGNSEEEHPDTTPDWDLLLSKEMIAAYLFYCFTVILLVLLACIQIFFNWFSSNVVLWEIFLNFAFSASVSGLDFDSRPQGCNKAKRQSLCLFLPRVFDWLQWNVVSCWDLSVWCASNLVQSVFKGENLA